MIAKAGNAYLYVDDLPAMPPNTASDDSVIKTNLFIEKWALKNVLLEKALFNLPQAQQEEFNAMAEQYRVQLYINAYRDALVDKNLSASFTEEEILAYYEENKANFKLKETLLKLRYLVVKSNLIDIDEIKAKFSSYSPEDMEYIQNKSLEYKMIMLNDSVWVRKVDVQKQFTTIEEEFTNYALRENNKTAVFQDTTYTYLVHVMDVLKTNEIPPISYLKPTIVQILENKRKLELNKELEKEILNDAIQNDDYILY